MKKVLTTAILLILAAQAWAQDFNSVYPEAVKQADFSGKLYNGAVRPVWTDAGTFLYRTMEPAGEAWYKVTAEGKTAVGKEEYENATKRFRRGYYDPSDESQYFHRREVKEFSPDSSLVAYVRDNNVWVSKADGSEAKPLSFDGTDLEKYTQIMWSPDGRKLAALRKEVIKERVITLRESRPDSQVQPKYRNLDYAKPGDRLPQCTPALFDMEKGVQVALSRKIPRDQYFLELGQWSPNSDFFTYEYNQRGHQLYELAAVNAENGAVRSLAVEKTNTFVYYYDLWRYMFRDGKKMLWISERDNWRHLYEVNTAGGPLRQITKGEWNVREIHRVDEENGIIIAAANGLNAAKGEDPYNKHIIRIDIATGAVKDITPENANHNVTFAPEGDLFVDNYSRPDLPSTSVLRSAKDGSVVMELQKEDISAIKGFTMPEVFVAKGRDGVTDIWGTIYRPLNFNPKKKYPVVEYIYAGPHDSHVEKDFMSYSPRWMRLTQLGFIVVCIDGMGTDNRSKSFQDVAWRNIKDAGFPDRILWIKAAAAKYKYMDISKVGIYGYSAGGQNTLSALLFHPEFYKVGVALCGCHDNRMDKIWWNEQWMGYPIGPWYSESSNVDNAWRLEGKLLIINGEMDDNVDPATSLQVVSELVKHNKDFEQLYLPGHTHNLGSDWITRRVYEFFYRNCR